MGNSSEKYLQNKMIEFLKKWNKDILDHRDEIFWEKRSPTGLSYKKGIPDMYLVLRGFHIEIEIKVDDEEELASRQLDYQDLFSRIAYHWVITDLKDFKNKLVQFHQNILDLEEYLKGYNK